MRSGRRSPVGVAVAALLLLAVALLGARLSGSDTGSAERAGDPVASAPTARSTGDAAASGRDPHSGLPWVEESELPAEAVDTLALIDAGGPFPYPGRDGSTFRNEERLLPTAERGYYREYTVPTPGEEDRGARRIVTGEGGEYYWTDDHYESFWRIAR